MRHVMISQEELKNIRELYEGVMSNASHGLFFKEGSIIGIGIVSMALKDRTTYFETCRDLLIERNWVKDVQFTDNKVTVTGSIEGMEGTSKGPTCHRLRGIIRKIYETYRDQKVYCKEIECVSTGKNGCVFEIGSMDMWR